MRTLWNVFVLSAALLAGAARAAPPEAAACLECHRPGNQAGELPLLEGQNADYLKVQLQRFRAAHRTGFPMEQVAQALEADAIDALAAHFAGLAWAAYPFGPDRAAVDAGRVRAAQLQCANCHLPGYAGTATIPRIAGQNPEYLARQLRAFGAARRHHPPTGIGSRMYTLSDADVTALSQYIASRDDRPDVDWIAGAWCSAEGARSTEEHWIRARGGLLLGVHRDVDGSAAKFFEFLRIELGPGTAVYKAQPFGRAPAIEFPATELGPLHAVFANPAHDFPRRIRYELRDDTLIASVDDGAGANTQTWTWRRDCQLP